MSTISLGGLISGMNTDEVIAKLTDLEAKKITVQESKKLQVQMKQTSVQRIKTAFETLKTKLDALRQSSTYNERKATAADTTILDATVTSGTSLGIHSINVTSLAQAHVVTSTSNAASDVVALGLTAGNINLNGKTIAVDGTDSLYSLRTKINGAGANVTADIVKVVNGATTSYRLNLSSTKLGTANAITLSDDQGGAIVSSNALQFKDGVGAWAYAAVTEAKNAEFTLNNAIYSIDTNTVTSLPGVTLTLKKTGATTVTVEQNADKTASTIQDWANAINAAFTQMDTETKITMKDGSLDKTKARGNLAGDQLIRGFQQSLRGFLSKEVTGLPVNLNRLSQIGITTGAWGTADYGKVVVDTAKLTEEIKKDPNAVARIFGAVTDVNTSGIAKDMYTYVNDALIYQTGPIDSRDALYTKQVKDYDDRIARISEHLSTYQASLKKQFARMESILAKMNTQSAAFTQQVQSLQGIYGNSKK